MSPLSTPLGASEDEQRGITIVKNALKAPLVTIVDNAGGNSSLVVDRVLNGTDVAYGYDALRDEYVDMYKAGERAGLAAIQRVWFHDGKIRFHLTIGNGNGKH